MMDQETTLKLLANLTHQVINPLNGVVGTLDNILDNTVPTQKVNTRLNSARGQLECTISLVRNLAFFAEYTKDYAKIKAVKNDKICIIPQIAIESAQFFQEQAREHNVKIEIFDMRTQAVKKGDSFLSQVAVKGNPDLLRQVFMNIFDNGVKYGVDNSLIEFKYWIKLGTGDLHVVISGKSIGFSSAEDIFELGIRGKEAMKKTSSGSGLGLHICKLIIENVFGGTISAQHIHKIAITEFNIKIPGGFEHEARIH